MTGTGALLVGLVLGGCGTTVPLSDRAEAGSLGTDGRSAGDLGAAEAGSGTSAAPGGSPSQDVGAAQDPGAAAGAQGGAGTGSAGSDATSGQRSRSAPVPSGAITIGFVYLKNAQQQVSAVGAKNLVPDMRAGEEALVRDLNAHGGLNGHHVRPVFTPFNATSSAPADEWQRICTTFTQDSRVFAAVVPAINDPSFSRCLSKGGVVEVSTLLTTEGQADFAAAPLLVEPASFNLDRLAEIEPRQLVAQGWLSNRDDAGVGVDPKPKVGVVVFDKAGFREAYERHLKPTLAGLGAPVADVEYVGDSAEALSSQMPNVVLRFAQDGINHVTFLTSTGLAPGLFLVHATQQQFKPRYGFSSQDAMGVVIEDLPDPKGQLHQSVLAGWFPQADVKDYNTPENAQPRQAACLALMRQNQVQESDGNSAGIDGYMCDSVWFLRDALRAGGAAVSTQSFMTGVDRLAGAYQPATTFATFLSRARRDGASQIRHASFAEQCTCFSYTSRGIRVS